MATGDIFYSPLPANNYLPEIAQPGNWGAPDTWATDFTFRGEKNRILYKRIANLLHAVIILDVSLSLKEFSLPPSPCGDSRFLYTGPPGS